MSCERSQLPPLRPRGSPVATHPELALDKAAQLVITHDSCIGGHPRNPALEGGLDEAVVVVFGRGGALDERKRGNDRLGVVGRDRLGELGKVGVRARDGAVWSRVRGASGWASSKVTRHVQAELRKVGRLLCGCSG